MKSSPVKDPNILIGAGSVIVIAQAPTIAVGVAVAAVGIGVGYGLYCGASWIYNKINS